MDQATKPLKNTVVKLLYLDDLCDGLLELVDEEIDLAAVVVHSGQLVHQSLITQCSCIHKMINRVEMENISRHSLNMELDL